jgi:hypothetical protein
MRLTDDPKSLAEMKPDTIWPPGVQDVMKRALQRKSNDRYQKAQDFGNALYMAIERMPKNSMADMGTMVMGAETAVLTFAPPPTRVDPNPSVPPTTRPSAAAKPSAPATPMAPAKSKTPLYAGGGVAAVAAMIAAYVVISKSGGGAPVVKHDSIAAVTPTTANVAAKPTSNPGGGTSTQLPVTQGSPASSLTTPPPIAPKPTGRTAPVSSAVDVSARLPDLLSESAEDRTAAKALNEARALAPKAVGSNEIIGLSLVRAQALGVLGKDKESCDILNTIKERAAGTKYDESVQRLLKLSC